MNARRIAGVLASAGALAVLGAAPADARVRHVWVAAVPNSWNVAPSGHDPISGEEVDPAEAIFGTVDLPALHGPLAPPVRNSPRPSSDGIMIPGPLIRARVGDRLRIHFKNMDSLREDPHSMHFHGVHYRPGSDGAFIPGFSGKDGNVRFGRKHTYRLTVGRDSVGVWPYHDHSPSMEDSIHGGMFGMLSIFGRHEPLPDREFQVVISPFGTDFMTINGRAFVGNTADLRSPASASASSGTSWRWAPSTTPSMSMATAGSTARAAARHPDRRAGGELPLPLARAGSRHVALPLPRRGSHDARHDRAVPRQHDADEARVRRRARRGRHSRGRPAASAAVPVDIQFQAFSPTASTCCPARRSSGPTSASGRHTVTADDESFDSDEI